MPANLSMSAAFSGASRELSLISLLLLLNRTGDWQGALKICR